MAKAVNPRGRRGSVAGVGMKTGTTPARGASKGGGIRKQTSAGGARTGKGLGGEFSKTRDVNSMGGPKGKTGWSGQGPGAATLGGSQRKQPPFNGSNVYGITARAGSKNTRGSNQTGGGGAYGSQRGNSMLGSGSAKASQGPAAPRGRGR